MLEKFKKHSLYVSYFNSVYHLSYSGCHRWRLPAFNLVLDSTICTCLLFGFNQSESHRAVAGLVGHACLHFYTSVWLSSGFTWFIFYLSNLLIYELDEISFHSWRFVSFVVLQPFILTGIYMVNHVSPGSYSFSW